jgi:hypothetical protein
MEASILQAVDGPLVVPSGMFMIRNRTRVVKRHPEGDW